MLAETQIFVVFYVLGAKTKKDSFPKQIVLTKMPFFRLPNRNGVLQSFPTKTILEKITFFLTTPKTLFLGIFCNFCFLSCLTFSNIAKAKTKNAIFCSKTSFLTSQQLCENTIWHTYALSVILGMPKKLLNWGK